jgi:hypothetical protein
MQITINNKKYHIKPASELTVSEYIELFDRFKPETRELGMLLDYLCVTLDLKYTSIADVNFDENTIRRLFAYIGEFLLAKDMPGSEQFYYKKTGKRYYQNKINWQAVGVRRMIEERNEDNQLKLAVYMLAIFIAGNYDFEKVEQIYDELQNYRAIDVYSFVIFFFKNLHSGKKPGKSFFRKLLKKPSTNTAN